MKLVLLLSAALLASVQLSGCVTNLGFPAPYAQGQVTRSSVSIPPGQTVMLGGELAGRFVVQARNTGETAVSVTSADGLVRPEDIQPDDTHDTSYVTGQTALLHNPSPTDTAHLKLTITAQDRPHFAMQYTSN